MVDAARTMLFRAAIPLLGGLFSLSCYAAPARAAVPHQQGNPPALLVYQGVISPYAAYPYGPVRRPRRPSTRVVRPTPKVRRGTGKGTGGKGTKSSIPRMKAPVDLSTEVQALQVRHGAFVTKLPNDLQRLDHRALPTIEKLPSLAQVSYLTTVEDYASLPEADRTRLRESLQGIADIPETDRSRFIDAATKRFNSVQSDAAQLKSARSKPHETFFQIKQALDDVKTAPAPAPKSS